MLVGFIRRVKTLLRVQSILVGPEMSYKSQNTNKPKLQATQNCKGVKSLQSCTIL
jgi:hypothetical protein